MKIFKNHILKALFFMVFLISVMLPPLFAQEASSTEEKEIKNVLVVNSYHIGYEWADDIVKGIQSVLSDNNFHISIEHLDSKRYSDEIYSKQFEESIRSKYGAAKIDAIIVSDHNAFYLMLEMRKTFHTDVPLVFCGIDRIDPEDLADYKPIYGVLEGDSGIQSTLDLILSIHPGINKIFFVADQTTSAGVMLGYVRDYEPSYKENVAFDYLIHMSTDELKVALKNVPPNSVVMWLHFIKDKNEKVLSLTESQTFVAKNTSVPVYVCYGFSADTGIVGGSIIRGFNQGEKAALVVMQLLNREDIVPIPFSQQSTFTNVFDYKVMKRFNIGIKDTPENSIVYNKPFSVYETYRWQIIGISIFTVIQMLTIILMLINQRRRMHAEKSRRESESRFRATFDQATVGIAHVSPEGRFLRINQKFCDITGYSHEEMLMLMFQDITHPDDLDADIMHVNRLMAGETKTYSMEKRYYRKSGEIVWVDLTVSLVRNEAGRPQWFVSVINDITDRKKVETALREREATLGALLNAPLEIIMLVNREGTVLSTNKGGASRFGKSTEEMIGHNIFQSMPDEVAQYRKNYGEEVFKTEKPIHFEDELEGTYFANSLYPVFDAAGEKVVSVAVFSSDITKRKQAEEALRQSHDLLEHILSSVPDAILSIKMPERTINWANDSFNVLGYEPEEYVGQSAKKYYANPEDYYAVGDLQQNAIRKGDDVISTEVMGLRKDGRVIPVELTATFYKEEGKLSLVTACIRDISVRKQAEEASRQSHDFLQHLTTSMPGAVFSTKMPERTIEWANDSFHVLGYEPEECVGKTTEFLYPSQKDFLAFGDMIEHAISEGEEVLHVEQILRKKSGEIFPAGISLSFFKKEAELVSITAIVQDISERKQKEQQLQIYQQRLKALAYQLTITEERERHAIATDLHDHVGQSLALARIQLTSARQFASESKLVDKLDDISGTLLKILEDTQLLMLELSSPAMHETGLSSAISEWLESQIENRHSLKTEVIDNISHNRRKTLDANVRTILFRNVRELIINVVKHARTNKVSVRLEDRDTSIRVIVEDDGIGFDPLAVTQADSKAGGFGLFSIQELMADLGGDLKIVSEPGKGCTAILSAPFSDEEIT